MKCGLASLEAQGCPFVPRLLRKRSAKAPHGDHQLRESRGPSRRGRARELFAELLPYGVRHDDAEMRNVTYRQSDAVSV